MPWISLRYRKNRLHSGPGTTPNIDRPLKSSPSCHRISKTAQDSLENANDSSQVTWRGANPGESRGRANHLPGTHDFTRWAKRSPVEALAAGFWDGEDAARPHLSCTLRSKLIGQCRDPRSCPLPCLTVQYRRETVPLHLLPSLRTSIFSYTEIPHSVDDTQ